MELPIGFGMALAQNPEAMQAFAQLPESRKEAVIAGTHAVQSRDEMHRYVANLLNR